MKKPLDRVVHQLVVEAAIERYHVLRRDPTAEAWGAPLSEAVLHVLCDDAPAEAIAELEAALREALGP